MFLCLLKQRLIPPFLYFLLFAYYHFVISCNFFSVLLAAEVLAQKPVEINFSPELVQVQTGTAVLFTVQTESQVFSMSWKYQNGETIALWTETGTSVNNVNQFVGRITISATQLRIGAAQLNDAGFYTVEVVPVSGMNLATASKSVELKVFGKN